jgi:hypothetical protein
MLILLGILAAIGGLAFWLLYHPVKLTVNPKDKVVLVTGAAGGSHIKTVF